MIGTGSSIFRSQASRVKRLVRNGMVPPECDQIQRMSGNFTAERGFSKIRLATVRVVSVAYSMALGGTTPITFAQHSAGVGWT